MKSAHRFDYARFGEALVERGLIDREVLSHVLHQVNAARGLLPEVLVRENLVSDWEISRVVCEIYHLPFLTVDQYPPSATALDGYDLAYLRHFALVPLDRFGGLVTVVMPGLVPSEVLEGLRPGQGGRVLAVVGSVVSNRKWIEERFAPKGGAAPAKPGAPAAVGKPVAPAKPGVGPKTIPLDVKAPVPSGPQPSTSRKAPPAAAVPAAPEAEADNVLELNVDGDWGNLFDAGDEAVQLGLKKPRP